MYSTLNLKEEHGKLRRVNYSTSYLIVYSQKAVSKYNFIYFPENFLCQLRYIKNHPSPQL